MSDREDRKQRAIDFMESDYITHAMTSGNHVAPEGRVASALEYIAYQMGQIRKDLRRIADKLDPKA